MTKSKQRSESVAEEQEPNQTPVEVPSAPVEETQLDPKAKALESLRARFGPYRTPTDETKPKFKQIQEAALGFAELIFELCPDSQQRSSALTLLEQAKMSANAAIAIHTSPTTAKKGAQA